MPCHDPSPSLVRDICDKNRDKYCEILQNKPVFLSSFRVHHRFPIASPSVPSYHDKCPVAPSNLPSPLALSLPEIATCRNSYRFDNILITIIISIHSLHRLGEASKHSVASAKNTQGEQNPSLSSQPGIQKPTRQLSARATGCGYFCKAAAHKAEGKVGKVGKIGKVDKVDKVDTVGKSLSRMSFGMLF